MNISLKFENVKILSNQFEKLISQIVECLTVGEVMSHDKTLQSYRIMNL